MGIFVLHFVSAREVLGKVLWWEELGPEALWEGHCDTGIVWGVGLRKRDLVGLASRVQGWLLTGGQRPWSWHTKPFSERRV